LFKRGPTTDLDLEEALRTPMITEEEGMGKEIETSLWGLNHI